MTADSLAGTVGPRHAPPLRSALDGVVLPKILRRPARMLAKTSWRLPRYFGSASVAVLFATTVTVGIVAGGHVTGVVSAITSWAGLAIEEVRITGQSRTEELDVLNKLAIGPFPSLVTFDIDAAKARLQTLPWVAEAALRKLYPNHLNVIIRERQPFAVWQDGNALRLIDGEGVVITDRVDFAYADLPMVVGEGAGSRIAEFTALLAKAPAIAKHTRAGVLIAERRWTLVLDSGVELMLPEGDPAAALLTVVRLDTESKLLSRAIAAVDLRDPTHVVLRLDAEGVSARTALLKARAAAAKAKI